VADSESGLDFVTSGQNDATIAAVARGGVLATLKGRDLLNPALWGQTVHNSVVLARFLASNNAIELRSNGNRMMIFGDKLITGDFAVKMRFIATFYLSDHMALRYYLAIKTGRIGEVSLPASR
jgi:hypothetical protein